MLAENLEDELKGKWQEGIDAELYELNYNYVTCLWGESNKLMEKVEPFLKKIGTILIS
jgi:hypothetical protein